ncbi:Polycomb complex protein BMI-1 [Cyphomyrmex costatus]|uniref:Polycomb complex protein BMI-1 n=1 Tax=Cyphomyrmex costatus TaxID=456900 RepID=A0A195CU18_9HYME|nr:Polycomb complex protein BMI-1 [Cyphomyrmex costatus]
MEAKERKKPLVKDLNEHIVCPLCRGYLIDATTLVECLHSFCRGCIVRRLSSGARACPVCNVATSPPLLPDARLQRLVYLAVPGLFRSELERRCHFRLVNPQCPPLTPPVGALDLTLEDLVSLSLQELGDDAEDETPKEEEEDGVSSRKDEEGARSGSTRYLKCPAAVTVRHLVRLLMLKRGWEEANATVNGVVNRIKILYQKHEETQQHPDQLNMYSLDPSWTLLDLACIFRWKKEAPMKLFYRVLRKEEVISILKVSAYKNNETKDVPPVIENIQRPPTPPPSPKPNRVHEAETRNTKPPRALETNVSVRDKEIKTKKPRCEVTPVMRTLDPPSAIELSTSNRHRSPEKMRSKDRSMPRLEHRKRRKRRKRVIAEITTVPREDLLKLKVRLTPCPPRITSGATGSGSGNSQTKEKLLQMRAVRRDKLKSIALRQRSPTIPLVRVDTKPFRQYVPEPEETIEDIIDSIPDEVVHIAQNINNQNEEGKLTKESTTVKKSTKEMVERTKTPESSDEGETPKKDEEILRRLGLVAVNEASGDRTAQKQRAQSSAGNADKAGNLNHDKLEKQLRENKANRVRSLLAEKKMRDALKTIISKKEELSPSVIKTPASALTSTAAAAAATATATATAAVTVATPASTAPPVAVPVMPKLKEPPPLTPIHIAKSSGFAATSVIVSNVVSKYETPLDLSSGGGGTTVDDNVLDLSATTVLGNVVRKSKEAEQQRGKGQQESNLKTLSDVAVSRMGSTETKSTTVDSIASTNVASNKVALRIPQPHHRISGFGMKSKPNLGVRHIPNPQVVVSQYRNQKLFHRNYFNIAQKP